MKAFQPTQHKVALFSFQLSIKYINRYRAMSDLDVFVGDLLGCGLFDDGVLAHDMPLDVRPSDKRLRGLRGRRHSELLHMSQRARCGRLHLLFTMYSSLEPVPLHDRRFIRRLNLLHDTRNTISATAFVLFLHIELFHL